MRILLAGATGAIGRRLVPRLVTAGREVTGMTRSEFVNQTPGQRLSLPIPEEPAARALRVPPSAYDAGSVLPAPALLVVPTSSPPAPAVLVPGGPVKRPAPAVAPSARRRGA